MEGCGNEHTIEGIGVNPRQMPGSGAGNQAQREDREVVELRSLPHPFSHRQREGEPEFTCLDRQFGGAEDAHVYRVGCVVDDPACGGG